MTVLSNPDDRFVAKCIYVPATGCIEWQGRRSRHSKDDRCGGYGVFRIKTDGVWRNVYAHRYALAQVLGRPIREGCDVDHRCDNRACVNPEHLRELSHAENVCISNKKRRKPCR